MSLYKGASVHRLWSQHSLCFKWDHVSYQFLVAATSKHSFARGVWVFWCTRSPISMVRGCVSNNDYRSAAPTAASKISSGALLVFFLSFALRHTRKWGWELLKFKSPPVSDAPRVVFMYIPRSSTRRRIALLLFTWCCARIVGARGDCSSLGRFFLTSTSKMF
jgi:hypothetical protein